MTVTQPADKKTKNGSRFKKVRNILLKVFGAIGIAIVLFLGIVYITNVIRSNSEAKRLEPYGQHEHEKLIKDSVHGEMVLLEANHYLYRSHSKEIAERLRGFMEKIQ